MAPQKSPAFQFYAKDFLTGTSTLSLAERGAYVTLLAHQWDAGSVPDSAKERARILGCSKSEERKIWARLVSKFSYQNDAFINLRLEEERQKQAEYRRRQSDAGKASAATKRQPDANHGSTTVDSRLQPEGQPKSNSSSSSSSSSSKEPAKNAGSSGRAPTLIARNEGVTWFKRHGAHVDGFCDWVCLAREQLDEFAAKIPGEDVVLKRGEVITWANHVRSQWADRIIPDGSHFDFWRNRWTETHGGSRPANATLKAARAANDIDEAFR